MNDDRELVERIAAVLEPRPMDAGRRAAFRIAIEQRVERRSAVRWRAGLALAATGALAAALWFTDLPVTRETPAPEIARVETPSVVSVPDAALPEPFLAAYANPDEILDEVANADDYLPDDYLVLASFVEDENG